MAIVRKVLYKHAHAHADGHTYLVAICVSMVPIHGTYQSVWMLEWGASSMVPIRAFEWYSGVRLLWYLSERLNVIVRCVFPIQTCSITNNGLESWQLLMKNRCGLSHKAKHLPTARWSVGCAIKPNIYPQEHLWFVPLTYPVFKRSCLDPQQVVCVESSEEWF